MYGRIEPSSPQRLLFLFELNDHRTMPKYLPGQGIHLRWYPVRFRVLLLDKPIGYRCPRDGLQHEVQGRRDSALWWFIQDLYLQVQHSSRSRSCSLWLDRHRMFDRLWKPSNIGRIPIHLRLDELHHVYLYLSSERVQLRWCSIWSRMLLLQYRQCRFQRRCY